MKRKTKETKLGGLDECCETCKRYVVTCPVKKCRYWIKYKDDLNCSLIAAQKGPLTLEETAKRLELTQGRIYEIEKQALKKLKQKKVD